MDRELSEDLSEAQVVWLAQQGDQGAFAELYRTWSERIYRHHLSLVKNREEAQDLTQQTFVRVFEKLSTLKEVSRFQSWLFRTATNLAFDHLRTQKRRPWRSLDRVSPGRDGVAPLDESDTMDGNAAFEQQVSTVLLAEQILEQMPPRQGECFRLYLQGWSPQSIATGFGMEEASVRTYMSNARRELRRAFWQAEGRSEENAEQRQRLALCQQAGVDARARRDFLRWFLAVSFPFAASSQAPHLQQFLEDLEHSTTPLSESEELRIVETLTQTCWRRLPQVANVVENQSLDDVRAFRQMLASRLANSPGASFAIPLASVLGEIEYIEAMLLSELNRLEEAAAAYRTARQHVHAAGNPLLEAVGLTWFGNFLIDTRRARQAPPWLEEARQLAERADTPPIVRAWIAATEADAWAHQGETHNSEVALSQAARWQDALDLEPGAYLVSYDRPWFFGFAGTIAAYLGRPSEAKRALEQGLAELDPAWTFRKVTFDKDLIIAHSLDHQVEEACRSARQAARGAAQAKAPMALQRVQDVVDTFLRPWRDSPVVRNLREEMRVLHLKVRSV